ncbi:hypothetical protein [Paraburkholderia gardini]|uniref:hypothetical protein n=1 Tax=Paraburkholderia gardini TaxID=2823469 RepID=UPI001D79AB01|nr:hypothetical protein [Paraburkholderia gardini]CAG4914118.1 hypothetical protein R69919_04168 [Paraburkholderia gardini]
MLEVWGVIQAALHGHLSEVVHDPRNWLGLTTFIAVCVAGWYAGDVAFAFTEKLKEKE